MYHLLYVSFYRHRTFKFYKEPCGVAAQCSRNHFDVEATEIAQLELRPCSVGSYLDVLPSLSTESLVVFIHLYNEYFSWMLCHQLRLFISVMDSNNYPTGFAVRIS